MYDVLSDKIDKNNKLQWNKQIGQVYGASKFSANKLGKYTKILNR